MTAADDDASTVDDANANGHKDKANASGDNANDDGKDEGAAEMKSNSDDDDDEDSTHEDAPSPPDDATHPDDLLLRAMTHKEDGNAHFKSGDYSSATRSYRRGTNALKNLNSDNSGDEQVKSLLITLQTNLSMVCYKQSKHKMSRDVASKALEIDAANVKALYRRAVAHRALGDADAARTDLRAALKEDPNNVPVKKELVSIKKILEDRKAKEKARLSRAFSKGGGSLLYSDKEEAERRREREAKEKERREKEALEGRKKEWEDECVRRMAGDPPEEAISFEEWDKQRRKTEEKAEKARKKAKKAEEERKREERRRSREAQEAVKDDSDDDDELTEQELAMLRGYKKTSDGRTTSYFNREQTEHEKKLIGCIKPKRLEEATSSSPSSIAASISSSGGPSVWNASGTTWEEKDTTEWCKRALEKELLDTTSAYYSHSEKFESHDGTTYVASVKKVTGPEGDASVAIAGGKKRYIYDFHADVEYEIRDAEGGGDVVASGTLNLPEVHSANTSAACCDEEELEVRIAAWKEGPDGNGAHAARDCAECRKILVQDVRKSVLRFVEKFNAHF